MQSLLNDKRYATAFVASKWSKNLWAPPRIRQVCLLRGLKSQNGPLQQRSLSLAHSPPYIRKGCAGEDDHASSCIDQASKVSSASHPAHGCLAVEAMVSWLGASSHNIPSHRFSASVTHLLISVCGAGAAGQRPCAAGHKRRAACDLWPQRVRSGSAGLRVCHAGPPRAAFGQVAGSSWPGCRASSV